MIWHFCKADDTIMVEKIQKQALRYVFNNYELSYKDLREKSGKQLMYTNRLRKIMYFVHKCLIGKVPKYLENMYIINTNSRLMRKGTQLRIDKFNTIKYGSQSLRHQGCKLWNDFFDEDDNDCPNTCGMKHKINLWFPDCACNVCMYCKLCLM